MTRTGSFVFSHFVAGALVFILCISASAGTIATSPAPAISGPGLGFANVAAIITSTPNNDNVPRAGESDNNIIVPQKRFDSNNYIDIEFTVNPSDGVTEYQVSEFVDNNTGIAWNRYTMQLGFGTGNQFVQSASGDGLDFDSPDFDTPPSGGGFAFIATNEDVLTFLGGTQGNGAQPYQFRIDVPNMSRGTTFTLRQIPQPVPEPSTTALLMLAITAIYGRRKNGR
jgi:hypothetical protein